MPQMHKYGESKLTRIVMAAVHHVTLEWDIRNSRLVDFCWMECTYVLRG